jgi:protein-tyrosine phosphatase
MVDIHCHILPGLDDGAKSIEESIQMAETAIQDGISHVVATPHANADFQFDYDRVRQRQGELQERVGDRLKIGIGCDFHLSVENLQSIRDSPRRYSINRGPYLLVEFADFAIPPMADDALLGLQRLGLLPIITHPERNPLIRSQPHRLWRWLKQGCYVQVTAQSLLGRWGESIRRQAEQWLDQQIVHFMASDAHSASLRPLRLKPAYAMVAERWGQARARALFQDNPLAAFEGQELPFRPPLPPDPDRMTPPVRRRKRFIFF